MGLEQKPRSVKELAQENAGRRYLSGLGATWDDFSGKKVLDVGAHDGAFGDEAKKHGVDVVSFDIFRGAWNKSHRSSSDTGQFVQGDAAHLPFENESFDTVVSHAAADSKEFFEEAYRVLKVGGELRVGPTPITPEDSAAELPDDYEERLVVIRERSKKYIEQIAKEIGFSNFHFNEHPRNENGIVYCHFVLRK